MNIAAYCRVSTEKEDQLNSLEAQKNFFKEYTDRSGGGQPCKTLRRRGDFGHQNQKPQGIFKNDVRRRNAFI